MPYFRKKPVVIEAVQWFKHGDHPMVTPVQSINLCRECGAPLSSHGWVQTLEGGHNVCPCDWIIKGVAGEFYPCKPRIFAATYEPVAESDSSGGSQR